MSAEPCMRCSAAGMASHGAGLACLCRACWLEGGARGARRRPSVSLPPPLACCISCAPQGDDENEAGHTYSDYRAQQIREMYDDDDDIMGHPGRAGGGRRGSRQQAVLTRRAAWPVLSWRQQLVKHA